MLIRHSIASDPKSFEITPKSTYLNRRSFLKGGAALAGAALFPWSLNAAMPKKFDNLIKERKKKEKKGKRKKKKKKKKKETKRNKKEKSREKKRK